MFIIVLPTICISLQMTFAMKPEAGSTCRYRCATVFRVVTDESTGKLKSVQLNEFGQIVNTDQIAEQINKQKEAEKKEFTCGAGLYVEKNEAGTYLYHLVNENQERAKSYFIHNLNDPSYLYFEALTDLRNYCDKADIEKIIANQDAQEPITFFKTEAVEFDQQGNLRRITFQNDHIGLQQNSNGATFSVTAEKDAINHGIKIEIRPDIKKLLCTPPIITAVIAVGVAIGILICAIHHVWRKKNATTDGVPENSDTTIQNNLP